MTYKDITFCSADCLNIECERNKINVPHDLPTWQIVAWSDFSGDCKLYMPEVKSEFRQDSST